MMTLYKCEPRRNKECTKESCRWLCRMTTEKKYSRDGHALTEEEIDEEGNKTDRILKKIDLGIYRPRLRAAKRRNRERRLRKWKDGTAVMRQVVEIKRILKRGSKAWEAFIKSIVDTAIKIIDCVPAIPALEWRTEGTSPDCIDDCEHCDYATCPKMEANDADSN